MCSQKDNFYVSTIPLKDLSPWNDVKAVQSQHVFLSWWLPHTAKIRTITKLAVFFFRLHWQINSSLTLCHRKYAFTKACFCSKFWAEGKLNSLGDWDLRYQFEPNVLRIENEWVYTHLKSLYAVQLQIEIHVYVTLSCIVHVVKSFSDFVKNCWTSGQQSKREINQETNFTIISTYTLLRFPTQSVSELYCGMTSYCLLMWRFLFE